nr:unnamed protein product [Spirometra erinaceieuropaei]
MAVKGELICMILIMGVAAQGKNVDELGVFFGLHASGAQTVSTTVGPKSEWSVESEVRLYVDTSADVVILTCEVSLPSKQHSLHLLCPLIPETRLCFENCRRVCSRPDCSDSPELFSVDCVEDAFVRDMYNIWKFRYIINRYNVAIDGAWSCFHAGKETRTVNVTSVQTTSAAPSTAHLPLNLPHIWSFKQSSDGRIEDGVEAATHESMDYAGKLDIEEDFFSNTSSFTSREAWSSNGTLLSHLMQANQFS